MPRSSSTPPTIDRFTTTTITLGGSFMNDVAPRVAPGATIAGKEPFEISDLMEQMGDTITKVNATLDDMKDEVKSAVVSVGDAMDNANTLIVGVTPDVTRMAASGARLSGDRHSRFGGCANALPRVRNYPVRMPADSCRCEC